MIVNKILFLFLFVACAHQPYKPVSHSDDVSSYLVMKRTYISCGGYGNISTIGENFSGKLSFSFLSQNDSSFFQFKDPLGRKMLLMWITPEAIIAWNIFENRYYEYDAIRDYFPFLKVEQESQLSPHAYPDVVIVQCYVVNLFRLLPKLLLQCYGFFYRNTFFIFFHIMRRLPTC